MNDHPRVLPDLATMQKQLAEMQLAMQMKDQRIAALETDKRSGGISGYSVSKGEKGNKGVNVNGLRRFPIFLYAQELEAILADAPRALAFVKSHPELSRK